jgi:soluble lytic murein transglycosylase-like protein
VRLLSAMSTADYQKAHAQLFQAQSDREQAMVPAQVERLRAQTEQARAAAGLSRSQTLMPYDNDPSLATQPGGTTPSGGTAGSYRALLDSTEKKYGLPQGYLYRTGAIESGFDNGSVSKAGARGVFQFMPSTAKQYGLTNPHDPVASADAAGRLAADNHAALTAGLGRPPSADELYLAHNQGAKGALSILQNPNAKLQ